MSDEDEVSLTPPPPVHPETEERTEEGANSPVQESNYQIVFGVETERGEGEEEEKKQVDPVPPSSSLLSSYLPSESSGETVNERSSESHSSVSDSVSKSESQFEETESKSENESSAVSRSESEDASKPESQNLDTDSKDSNPKDSDSSKTETDSPDPVPDSKPEPNKTPSKPKPTVPPISPVPAPSSPTDSLLSPLSPPPVPCVLFEGVHYLGSSTVDAPVSENEANRKMTILKEQAAQSIPVTLSIPTNNTGSIILRDPTADQVLIAFLIRYVLFCARGQVDSGLHDCIAINVLHKKSGVYHCHVFRCDLPELCQRLFEAIGRAFKSKALAKDSNSVSHELDIQVDILEDDGKGHYSSVSMDKDCFKLRSNTKKKLLFNVSQVLTPSSSPLKFEKCFGILMAVGQDLPRNKLHLLDNAQVSTNNLPECSIFTVSGFWDTSLPSLAILNEETSKSKHHFITIAVDAVAHKVSEPIRMIREVKVRMSKGETLSSLLSTLTRRKLAVETMILSLEKVPSSDQYKIKSLKSIRETSSPSPSLPRGGEKTEVGRVASEDSPLVRKTTKHKVKEVKDTPEHEDSDQADDDDILVSGWGGKSEEDLSDNLLKLWSDMLEKWDGRDKWEPKGEKTRSRQLIKLVRKGIPGPLRCQIWQMLSGADNDPQLIEAFRILCTKDSPTESVIKWDIKRTFTGHDFFSKDKEQGRESLYRISKAYSVYDAEVGYCQGFSFMAAVLLLQKIPEEQAFAVMVKLMYNYGHRELFKANFKELHLMFYQLDRLLEEYHREIYEHFVNNSIETHMYASQWFLTIFTAKFSLQVVYHIIDIYLCEGVIIVFQIALALLKLAQRDLLALDFEGILSYFRSDLPKKYKTDEDVANLFQTATHYGKVNLRKLKKLERDYQVYLEQLAQEEDPEKRLLKENKLLQEMVLRLQRENDDLAEELVGSKVALRVDMDKLEERIDVLSKECRAHKTSLDSSNLLVSELKEELQQAKTTYQKAMIQLTEERQQHEVAITEYKQLHKQLDEGHQKQKEELHQELLEVKAKLGSPGSESSTSDHLSSLSSEQRLRQVELELAQTKLALVEAQCKNQELEHKIAELNNELSSKGKASSWLSRFN